METTGTEGSSAVLEHVERAGLLRSMPWDGSPDWAPLLEREWLVTNGLGGYASGTVSGAQTRRYHGLLVAAHPAPLGRLLMLMDLAELVRLPDGSEVRLGGEERPDHLELHGARYLTEFRLEWGLPTWCYRVGDALLRKRLVMPHGRNTVSVEYSLLEGPAVELELRPLLDFRNHDDPVDRPLRDDYQIEGTDGGVDVACGDAPDLRLRYNGDARFLREPRVRQEILYRLEADRGYAAIGDVWSPGMLRREIGVDRPLTLLGSTEPPHEIPDPDHEALLDAELDRRRELVATADAEHDPLLGELVLAADSFVIEPRTRTADAERARASGRTAKSVIAGYHWFTDWGRDTMISLEGLTLATGRHREAGEILRTFAGHVRDGLIPNLFPEGGDEGLYHTADATLWFFHAVQRYLRATGDRGLLRELLPTLRAIIDHHVSGTRFGIGVDPADGLLRQGEEGYQLTWMDAKVEGWVVTPRRGKAVEINALWYNALRLMQEWLDEEGEADAARETGARADRVRDAFNRRFWYDDGGYLYDVVDGPSGDDTAFRPNQVFALSLDHPVLDRDRWAAVMDKVRERLLTPVGLRSLAPGHPDYNPRYFGDLRTRDAAYHQGTVWGWLIGPFVDAWLAVHPQDRAQASSFLAGLIGHLDEACIGSLSEIFDADPPHTPRGCVAQAWTIAELLRCHRRTA